MHDQFAPGRRFRILNIVDDVTRECLAAIPDTSISGKRVAGELTTLTADYNRLMAQYNAAARRRGVVPATPELQLKPLD